MFDKYAKYNYDKNLCIDDWLFLLLVLTSTTIALVLSTTDLKTDKLKFMNTNLDEAKKKVKAS